MATYRFFTTAFWDNDNNCQTRDLTIYRIGKKGCVTTGSLVSFKKQKSLDEAGWWCFGTIKGNRTPETKEITQSTARKLIGRCPVRFYEHVIERDWNSKLPSMNEFIETAKKQLLAKKKRKRKS